MASGRKWQPRGDAGRVWRALLALRSGTSGGVGGGPDGPNEASRRETAAFVLDASGRWTLGGRVLAGEAAELAELYLPVCVSVTGAPVTIGHLGQTLDGRIATESGVSRYVTGPENILHLHRMRALCDAVLVGAETVRQDDPQLTTRLVPGENPVRVVLDPRRRLGTGYRVFQDGQAPTLLACAEDQDRQAPPPPAYADDRDRQVRTPRVCTGDRAHEPLPGPSVEVIGLPIRDGQLDLRALRTRLSERGLRAVFVEGGGVTVSRFLQQGVLDRLHVAVAPLILGSGRHGLTLPVVGTLEEALRPRTRVFRMGADVLFDCDLRPTAALRPAAP
ncbi:MAG: RibD family protein [Gammaproteobacteria bacterium]|jgi:riboflavin biosynthesis pyrimidine reductase|nr:RibD family protein [Gammaproteobacteria bacterium]